MFVHIALTAIIIQQKPPRRVDWGCLPPRWNQIWKMCQIFFFNHFQIIFLPIFLIFTNNYFTLSDFLNKYFPSICKRCWTLFFLLKFLTIFVHFPNLFEHLAYLVPRSLRRLLLLWWPFCTGSQVCDDHHYWYKDHNCDVHHHNCQQVTGGLSQKTCASYEAWSHWHACWIYQSNNQ